MTGYWLVGASALAMIAGTALAQNTTSSQTTTTTTIPGVAVPGVPVQIAPAPGYSTSTTERKVEGNGSVSEQSQSYKSGPGGTDSRTTSQAVAPDGSRSSSWREEWTNTQPAELPKKQTTTTTTTVQ